MVKFSTAGALVSTTFGMGCCLGPPGLATFASVFGLEYFFNLGVQLPILYSFLGFTIMGYALPFRNLRMWPLLLAVAGSGMVLFPFHTALDVWLFRLLIYGGLGLLLLAALRKALGCRKACGK